MNEIQTLLKRLSMLCEGDQNRMAAALKVSRSTLAGYRTLGESDSGTLRYTSALLRARAAVESLSTVEGIAWTQQ